MQVRIRKDPDYKTIWIVEKKFWWWPFWIEVDFFAGPGSKERALEYAKNFKEGTLRSEEEIIYL